MRPLELVLEGFRSWGDRATFDFRNRQLVAIVGPIGSGKSSLLDAIAFALYARTPRIEKEVAALIRQGCDEARVELLFEAGGSAYRAIRVIKRKGANQHALWRYADDAGAGEPIERLDRAREIDERLQQVVGLDFTAFCRSVLLAQNQFARFLEAPPAERDAVLKGLFGFERLDAMRDLARQREERCKAELGGLERRLSELNQLEQQLPGLEARTAAAAARVAQLRQAAPDFERVQAARAAATQLEEQTRQVRQALATIERDLPPLQQVADLASGASRRQATLDQANRALAQIEAALLRCEEAEATTLTAIATQTSALHHLSLERAEDSLRVAIAADHECRAALAAAGENLERATETLRRTEHGQYAALLREDLEHGQPCPVCEQPVPAVPQARPVPELDHARTQRALAENERALRALALERAHREAAAAEAKRNAAQSALEAWQATNPDVVASADPDPEAARAAATADLEQIRRERAALRLDRDRAQTRLAEAQAAVSGIEVEVSELVRRLERLAGRLDLDQLPEGLVAARTQLHDELERRIAGAEATIAETKATGAALDGRILALCTAVGLEPTTSFDGALAEAERSLTRQETELAALRDRLREAEQRRGELHHWREQLSIWSGLAEDLRPSRLLRHLLDEERRRLAAIAAERFENLSGGRYRFSPDGSFAVVDLANAEELRRLDTLSGGETFLAALALALALAEIVAGGGGRLDAFFLDEGFGSLDQEHLRLALDGIEHLVVDAPGRLVLLVSHVPEVQERFDDVISLDREPIQGTSIIRSGATPP